VGEDLLEAVGEAGQASSIIDRGMADGQRNPLIYQGLTQKGNA
jgi:hypothetical protein